MSVAQSSTMAISMSPRPEGVGIELSAPSVDPHATMSEVDIDFESSDDEAGVFFGVHNPIEHKIIAALSRSIPSSPASNDLCNVAGSSRRSSLLNRVKKRDSREFLRRKTMLPSDQTWSDKVWEGGFFEKQAETSGSPSYRIEPESSPSDTEVFSTPIRQAPSAEPINFFDSMELDDGQPIPEPNEDGSFMTSNGSSSDEEKDKENTQIPEPYYDSSEEEYTGEHAVSTTITLGFRPNENMEGDDVVTDLDMGGLSLLDIDDPELGPMEHADSYISDLLGDSDSQSDIGDPTSLHSSTLSIAEPSGSEVSSLRDGLLSPPRVPISEDDKIETKASEVEAKTLASPGLILEMATEEAQTSADSSIDGTGSQNNDDGQSELGDLSDISYASDMNSPVGRGPVVIPVFAVASPSRMSPLRGIEPAYFEEEMAPPSDVGIDDDDGVALPSLDSPTSSRMLNGASSPAASTPARSNAAPQKRWEALVQSGRPIRVLKSEQAMAASKGLEPSPTKPEDAKMAARTMAVRGQLSAAYSSGLASFGPTPRNVSNSSSDSSGSLPPLLHSTTSRTVSAASNTTPLIQEPTIVTPKHRTLREDMVERSAKEKPKTKKVMIGGDGAHKLVVSRRPNMDLAKSAGPPTPSTRLLVTSKAPPQSKLPSSLPKPILSRSTIPRPGTAVRKTMAPPTSTRPLKSALKAPVPITVQQTTPSMPTPRATPVSATKKRPLPSVQPSVARSLVSAGGPARERPTLGMPSRIVRDRAAELGHPSPLPGMVSGCSEIGGPLSRPPVRSPARPQGAPASAKRRLFPAGPSRPGQFGLSAAATPTSQRILNLGSPSRIVSTPSRMRTAGTPGHSRLASSTPAKSPIRGIQSPFNVRAEVSAARAVASPLQAKVSSAVGPASIDVEMEPANEATPEPQAAQDDSAPVSSEVVEHASEPVERVQGEDEESGNDGASNVEISESAPDANGASDFPQPMDVDSGVEPNVVPLLESKEPEINTHQTAETKNQQTEETNNPQTEEPQSLVEPTEVASEQSQATSQTTETPAPAPVVPLIETTAEPDRPSPSERAQTPPLQAPIPVRAENAVRDLDSGRPRRSSRPRTVPQPPAAAPVRAKAAPIGSIVPGMSEKELKTATHRNTMRNQVYFCAIDRQIVRVPGPRPPSPTSKIRTTAEREAEEKKCQRSARARRRLGDSDEESTPLIERISQARGPGDDDDYSTPARPTKRKKLSPDSDNPFDTRSSRESTAAPVSPGTERYVRWDRGLTVIRGGLGDSSREIGPSNTSAPPPRSALTARAKSIALDRHGNAVDRPVEKLRRTKVSVSAVFYDGEEPVPVPAPVVSSGKGRKR